MDYVVIGLLAGMLLLMFVIAILVADGIRLQKERHHAMLDAAFCRRSWMPLSARSNGSAENEGAADRNAGAAGRWL